jgi:hypothetical protein
MGGGLDRYLSASRLRQCGRRSEAVIRSDFVSVWNKSGQAKDF